MSSKNNSATKEIHLFILWENSRHVEEKLLADIESKFKVLKIYEVTWSKEKFSENLSRFYGAKLPPNARKERHIGTGPFLAVIVEDKSPVYKVHATMQGNRKVNTNLFSTKEDHRAWAGGNSVHATNSVKETNHDLTILFGKNTNDLVRGFSLKSGKHRQKWNHDIVGARGWENLKQLFYVLNNTVDYVVLRNFSHLPDDYYAKDHGDIDLLSSSYSETCFIANSEPVFKSKHRVHNRVLINGEKIYFDFRSIGDNYYDEAWEKAMINRRVYNIKGYYVPSPNDHFYSLLYHGLIHKPEISMDYIQTLSAAAPDLGLKLSAPSFRSGGAVKILSRFLKANGYGFTQPDDKSVYLHMGNVRIGQKQGVKFVKTKRIPLRNFLKKGKVPLKHYALKARRVARGQLYKLGR
ncbi:MAG TPA: hypothetical protein VFW90_01055 [Candidatus Saccharimonadales bacterium]|nr:hypothetical protein [Candidatus Saccharimonadales bacterium]